MKHPLDRARAGTDAGLSRLIALKKSALPRKASLDLQQRSRRAGSALRTAQFLRIARQQTAGIQQT